MGITKEDFIDGIKQLLADADSDGGELSDIEDTINELADDLREHDPVLAEKVVGIYLAVQEVVEHVRSRAQ